jgi:hypothetical protein
MNTSGSAVLKTSSSAVIIALTHAGHLSTDLTKEQSPHQTQRLKNPTQRQTNFAP